MVIIIIVLIVIIIIIIIILIVIIKSVVKMNLTQQSRCQPRWMSLSFFAHEAANSDDDDMMTSVTMMMKTMTMGDLNIRNMKNSWSSLLPGKARYVRRS